MEEKDNLEQLFQDLKGQFDVEEPATKHEVRFIEKLSKNSQDLASPKSRFWKPFLAIAASIVICLGAFKFIAANDAKNDLASVSPEMSEVQSFLTATISEELKKLEAERSPLTENIIYETERQLKALEDDYAILKTNLKQSGNDERVINAMISNFQSRIDILNNILEKIKDLKQKQYETEITL
ncbi:hypothetical protein DFQ05_0595 [Winogradskyella wandonensis]|uniref:Anti-sigma factor n=1 Tax=Winogradskyella wandonensis TaxID=1442586 RepID=A0A4R1KWP4_9FLAO|nr:hypothetical protein [Winogradskyella wandonensis]TCK69083.1 hypothetical protein DFQ05_0595 [Winogradskyella wandonensis]